MTFLYESVFVFGVGVVIGAILFGIMFLPIFLESRIHDEMSKRTPPRATA
jgi:uncharacterized membrane protein YciS (DUF1049 family)